MTTIDHLVNFGKKAMAGAGLVGMLSCYSARQPIGTQMFNPYTGEMFKPTKEQAVNILQRYLSGVCEHYEVTTEHFSCSGQEVITSSQGNRSMHTYSYDLKFSEIQTVTIQQGPETLDYGSWYVDISFKESSCFGGPCWKTIFKVPSQEEARQKALPLAVLVGVPY